MPDLTYEKLMGAKKLLEHAAVPQTDRYVFGYRKQFEEKFIFHSYKRNYDVFFAKDLANLIFKMLKYENRITPEEALRDPIFGEDSKEEV